MTAKKYAALCLSRYWEAVWSHDRRNVKRRWRKYQKALCRMWAEHLQEP